MRQAALALTGEGVRREADDRQTLALGERANCVGRFETVHLRHLNVINTTS